MDQNEDLPEPSRKPAPANSSPKPQQHKFNQEPRQIMYIERAARYYTAAGEQRVSRARFLILCTPNRPGPIDPITETRAIVRKVAMQQLGHWMMGTARAAGRSLTLSGSYGADGLTKTVPPEVYAIAHPVPPELMQQWATGGGWNSAGSEADAFRAWARENLTQLSPKP